MKKILALIVISFVLFGIPAFAGDVDLSGCWEVEIEGIDSEGLPTDENNYIWIDQENENFFRGWVCNDPCPAEKGMQFSGAIDGKDIYITHWDSFTKATLNGPGDVISGINQGQDIDKRIGKTSFATAIRVDDDECGSCESYNTRPCQKTASAEINDSGDLVIFVSGSDFDANAKGIYVDLFHQSNCEGVSDFFSVNFSPSVSDDPFNAIATIDSVSLNFNPESIQLKIVDDTGLLSHPKCINVQQ